MKHKSQYIPRYTAVFLLILIVVGMIISPLHSPAQVVADISNVTIYSNQSTRLRISGHSFTCPNPDVNDSTLTCTIELEGQLLAMQLNTSKEGAITNCAAQFGDRSIPCKGSTSLRFRSPGVILEDTLGISDAQFAQLRLRHWQDQLTEATWVRLGFLAVSLWVLNLAVLLWQSLSKRKIGLEWRTAVTAISSFILFAVLQLTSLFILLSQGWID